MVGRMMLRPRSVRSAGCKRGLAPPLRAAGNRTDSATSPKCPLRCLVAVLWALAVIVRKLACGFWLRLWGGILAA